MKPNFLQGIRMFTTAACCFVILFSGCKKGEDDPFISFRSRMARVSGSWVVSKLESSTVRVVTSVSGSTSTTTTHVVFDGVTNTTTVLNDVLGTVISTADQSMDLIFENDGTWRSKNLSISLKVDTIMDTSTINLYLYKRTSTTTSTIEESGTWNFLDGVGNAKKKEYLILQKSVSNETVILAEAFEAISPSAKPKNPETSTTTFSQTFSASNDIWQLVELSNKQMKAKVETSSSSSRSNNGAQNGNNITISGTSSISLKKQ